MFCKHCGSEIIDGDKFCVYCGKSNPTFVQKSTPPPVTESVTQETTGQQSKLISYATVGFMFSLLAVVVIIVLTFYCMGKYTGEALDGVQCALCSLGSAPLIAIASVFSFRARILVARYEQEYGSENDRVSRARRLSRAGKVLSFLATGLTLFAVLMFAFTLRW